MKSKYAKRIIIIAICILLMISLQGKVFAAGNCAFSVGAKYNDLNTEPETLKALAYYRQMGYNSYYTTEPTFDELNGYFKIGTRRLESDILFFSGHGFDDGSGMVFPNTAVWTRPTSQSTKAVGIDDFNWNTTKLVIYGGCVTALPNNSNHISIATYRKGAKTVLGWHQSLDPDSHRDWLNRFNAKLVEGASFSSAFNYASSFSYSDPRVNDLGIYGDWNMTYKQSRSGSTLENPNTIKISNEIEFNQKNQNIMGIIQEIRSINPNFNEDDYKVEIFTLNKEAEFYNIEFEREIDGYKTELGYHVCVNNGKVVSITNNDKNIITGRSGMDKLTSQEEEKCLEEARRNAIEDAKKGKLGEVFKKQVEVIKQVPSYYYDVNTGNKYYRVFSTVKNEDRAVDVSTSKKEI